MHLVLFDFDGTLTNFDSFVGFLNFYPSKKQLRKIKFKYAHKIIVYKAGLYSGEKLKQAIVFDLFHKQTKNDLFRKGEEYINTVVMNQLNPTIYAKLLSHIESKDHVCIVSASLDIWIAPFAKKHNIDYICTEIEFEQKDSVEICTGRFKTPNCNFHEKKNRILNKFKLDEFESVIAYGDSKGDDAMLTLADQKHKIKS